jgi:chromate transporter
MNRQIAAPLEGNTAPSFAEAFRFCVKLGFISFGGPTGQIAIIQTKLVEKKKWISQSRFLHALNYCMLLPGPEAQQLAIYIGWLLHKTGGGIVAGSFFVIPSIFVLWALSYVYAAFGSVTSIAAFFYGLKPAIMAIVAVAVIRIGRKVPVAAIDWFALSVSVIAFVGMLRWKWNIIPVVLGSGLLGLIYTLVDLR